MSLVDNMIEEENTSDVSPQGHRHSRQYFTSERSLSAMGDQSYLLNLMPLNTDGPRMGRVARSRSTLLETKNLKQCCYAELLSKAPVRGKVAEIASISMHTPCKSEITRFLFVMSLTMVAAMSGQYMNVCTYLFEAKYDWNTRAKRDRNQALMNTLPSLGTILGSGIGSVLM